MPVHSLGKLSRPTSVAVIGASRRAGAIGHIVLANIIAGGFSGEIYAVNPHRVDVPGCTWFESVEALPCPPDLAIIATPATSVEQIIRSLGKLGTPTAVIMSNGFAEAPARASLARVAREGGVRLIGPNSLGVLMPQVRLNASFASRGAVPGRLAFLSQSGALITAMLDWASDRHVGFSGIVSTGDVLDVDLADLIDVYASDPKTSAILLYIEGITDARCFMSAAWAATRSKPVIAIKAGRSAAAGEAAFSHTRAIAGSYDVHEAALRRAGVSLVNTMTELFDAAEALAHARPRCGSRVAIVTNGGGAGVLATDALAAAGGVLATLAPATIETLDKVLPVGWSRSNPIDVVGDARADRFDAAVAAALADSGVDALLILHCPTAVESGEAMAAAALRSAAGTSKPVIGAWLGPLDAAAARAMFDAADFPLFDTVEGAVRGFGYLREATQQREAILAPVRSQNAPHGDAAAAAAIVTAARQEGRCDLLPSEARSMLSAYGVPMVPTHFAEDLEAIPAACEGLSAPFVLKIASPDAAHKSDLGGVVTGLPDLPAVSAAATAMSTRFARDHPDVPITGFEIQPMVLERHGVEIIVGVSDDPVFGPVLAVGSGGKTVELVRDRALDLPPIDGDLARQMLARTRVSALLAGYRDVPPAFVDGILLVLEAVAALVADVPDIVELDINPLLVGEHRITAVDARVRISAQPRDSRMAIRPIPPGWVTDLVTRGGTLIHVRPVQPDDEAVLTDFFRHVSQEDLYFRFLTGLREVERDQIVAMTRIDYARSMHFLAFCGDVLVASALLVCQLDHRTAEAAVSVRADYRGKGVSWTLMQHVLRYARAEGIDTVESVEDVANTAALSLEREMGFRTVAVEGPDQIVRRAVRDPIDEPAGATDTRS